MLEDFARRKPLLHCFVDRQPCRGRRHASPRQSSLHFLQASLDPHAGCIFSHSKLSADGSKRFPLEKAQEHRIAILRVEMIERIIKDGPQAEPVGVMSGIGNEFYRTSGLRFAYLATIFTAFQMSGDVENSSIGAQRI